MQAMPASISFTMSSVSEEAGLVKHYQTSTNILPEGANDLRLAFGEVDLSEYVLAADLLKLLLLFLFFFFLAFLFLLLVLEDAALGWPGHIASLGTTTLSIILIFLVLLLVVRSLMVVTVHVCNLFFVCVHFILAT